MGRRRGAPQNPKRAPNARLTLWFHKDTGRLIDRFMFRIVGRQLDFYGTVEDEILRAWCGGAQKDYIDIMRSCCGASKNVRLGKHGLVAVRSR
jgi:hypothetical protein